QWAHRRAEAVQKVEELRGEIQAAVAEGRFHEYMPFAGQSAGLIHEVLPVREIIRRLMSQAEETLRQAPTLVARMGVGKDSPQDMTPNLPRRSRLRPPRVAGP